jgi:transcription-repair coupling factor (superfamily II helicase)
MLEQLKEELIDRFGTLPDATSNLFDSHALRITGKPLDLIKIDASAASITIQFGPDTPIHPHRVIQLVQQKRHFKLAGPDKLKIEKPMPNLHDRVLAIKAVLYELTPIVPQAKVAA